jgi:hypothetical protein
MTLRQIWIAIFLVPTFAWTVIRLLDVTSRLAIFVIGVVVGMLIAAMMVAVSDTLLEREQQPKEPKS